MTSEANEPRLRALAERSVEFRFAVDVHAFVSRLRDLAERDGASGPDVVAFASRLALDDLYLATACVAGDEAAWAECVDRYQDFIHRFARRVLKEPEAGDVAAQVVSDLWQRRKIERYEGRSTLRTWLGTVVSNAAINTVKEARSRESREAPAERTSSTDLESEIGDVERSTELAKLLGESIARQSTGDQLLILLHYEQRLTLDEIGLVVGRSKAALSRRLKRIRTALLEMTDTLAQRRLGTSARALADGLELSKVDLDLRAACRQVVQQRTRDLV